MDALVVSDLGDGRWTGIAHLQYLRPVRFLKGGRRDSGGVDGGRATKTPFACRWQAQFLLSAGYHDGRVSQRYIWLAPRHPGVCDDFHGVAILVLHIRVGP